jgi:acetyltransferase-like isoleucine patch superfamily enzyme
MNNYTREELLALGFSHVGQETMVSRDVRFFDIRGVLDDQVRIDAYTIITGEVHLGQSTHVSPLCFLSATGGVIVMEESSGIGPQVSLLTKSDNYTSADLTEENKLAGDIHIGRHSILGAGCKVFPGVTIGGHASIGSNCVINRDVAAGDMIVSRGAPLISMGNRLDS